MPKLVRLLLLALAALLVISAPAAGERKKKKIFFLNSYHNGYTWSDDIVEGVRQVLFAGPYPIELQIEYMDAKRYPPKVMGPQLFDLYSRKYAGEEFDAVIASDNDAYDFILDYGPRLFPGVPVVFCGINDFEERRIEGREVTGVLESLNAKETLDIALALHPEKRRMIVIGDESTTGWAIRHQIEDVAPAFAGRLAFEFWSQDDLAHILDKVRDLPADTFLYFIPFYQNIGGAFYSAAELLESVAAETNAPLYSSWEFLLDHGTVGGKLLSGVRHGQDAARLALRVLSGEKAASIPIIRDTQAESLLLFDWNVLQRLHIDHALLPPGSSFINEPRAFYELDKELFWTIMVSLALMLVILALLARNIVRRRAVEEKIKDQLSFREILLDTLPQLICWKDREQRYLGVNRSFTEFFGLKDAQEFISRTDAEMQLDPDFVRQVGALDRQVTESERPILKHRLTVCDANGEAAWLEITKVPLRDEKGRVVGSLSTADNVTREVSLERQLVQSQKMEAIGTLAGGLAHDFNNILTSIINSTELALGDITPETMTSRDLERVLKAASRGSRVVKQILTFSRPSQEGFAMVNASEPVREALGLVEASLPRNITIHADIPDRPISLHTDPTQIHQVVMNLCTNSFQALRETGGRIEVGLAREWLDEEAASVLGLQAGGYARLSVADDGPGIPPEIADKVFDPFFTTKDKTEGTGLGLAVVHGIVKGHQGAVRLTSVPWERTAVDIFLPLRHGDQAQPVSHAGAAAPGRERVLFVEDDVDQLATTPRLLESLGYAVTASQYPAAALKLLAEGGDDFDLVVTDFDMPETNGLELARSVAHMLPGLPVIIVSGREVPAEAASLANVAGVVMKPYTKENLSQAIRQALAA
jgi:PAS domain S-box-containing protein